MSSTSPPSTEEDPDSILSKLDATLPTPLAQFDAFPKLPSTYKHRSDSRGFLTIFTLCLSLLLVLNDVGEFIWGWPDFEFSVGDSGKDSFMNVNVDLTVAMPCRFLSVDLRDAIGDRLYLSSGLRRDGTLFDISGATKLKEHAASLSAAQAVSQARSSRGFFGGLFRSSPPSFRPTYKPTPDSSSCRVWGSLQVKKVTANLHITALGHGYASYEHVEHRLLNMSHSINEFSFGPFFPDITQPLDYSYEIADSNFIAYQYFLHVVPTTYVAPRAKPLQTNQYSVTHYTRVLEHDQGTPGIFFKFDLDPLHITIHQRTTTFMQLLIRMAGVVGGVFVCTGYAIRVTTRAVEVVTGPDTSKGLVAAEASGAKVGLRQKWGGATLRARPQSGRLVRQGSGWTMEGAPGTGTGGGGSPYASYAGTPMSASFGAQSPYLASPDIGTGGYPGSASNSSFGPLSARVPPPPRTPRVNSSYSAHSGYNSPVPTAGLQSPMQSVPLPGTPAFGNFPPTPNPAGVFPGGVSGSASPGPPKRVSSGPKKDD